MIAKHWAPNATIQTYLATLIEPDAKVLEVGPGSVPFARSTHFVRRPGDTAASSNTHYVDVTEDALPFAANEFDFVYCRHVIEDLYNPFPLIKELRRVGKHGYLETPSPICELTRGIDGCSHAEIYKGYIHHRWIVWEHEGQLHLVEKNPQVEHLNFDGRDELKDPFFWNTSLLWDNLFPIVHHQHDVDFLLQSSYGKLLGTAIEQSRQSIDKLKKLIQP